MSCKKIGKQVTMLVVTLTIFAITLAVVHAGSSASWTNPAGSYSPYTGVASTREWVSGWVYVEGHMKRFFWHSGGHNSNDELLNDPGLYWDTRGLASLNIPFNTAFAQGPIEQSSATIGPKFPRTEEELEKYKQEALARADCFRWLRPFCLAAGLAGHNTTGGDGEWRIPPDWRCRLALWG